MTNEDLWQETIRQGQAEMDQAAKRAESWKREVQEAKALEQKLLKARLLKRAATRKNYGGAIPFGLDGYIHYNKAFTVGRVSMRFVENAGAGLRRSKEFNRTGNAWYCDEYGDRTLTGVVFLLPHGRMVAGYEESDNDGIALSLDTVYTCEREAFRAADELARIVAEHEREYNEGYNAAQRAVEALEEASDVRQQALKLLQDLRPLRKTMTAPASVCEALRCAVDVSVRRLGELKDKARELFGQFSERGLAHGHEWHKGFRENLTDDQFAKLKGL